MQYLSLLALDILMPKCRAEKALSFGMNTKVDHYVSSGEIAKIRGKIVKNHHFSPVCAENDPDAHFFH